MNWMRRTLSLLLGRKQQSGPPPEEAEALRIAFKERYHSFKLLLSANNRALDMMTDMEQALKGNRPFGMPFVRANCTGIAVNVLRMIRKMDALAPGKYAALRERFENIRGAVDPLLTEHRTVRSDVLILPLDDTDRTMSDLAGSKMANIGEIRNRVGMRTPAGFVVTARAYERFVRETGIQTEINRVFQSADPEDVESLYTLSADIRQKIIRAELPPDIADAVTSAWKKIEEQAGGPVTMALRSSAHGEDSPDSSFAGQYASELNISFDNALDAYKTVVSSKYTLQAITYRLNRGFRDEDIPMSVGCLVMVDAAAGGVAYSRNPVDVGDDSIVINAAWGLPKSVVDGSGPCDLFVISRTDLSRPVREEIRNKDVRFVCYPDEGVCRLETAGDIAAMPSVSRETLKAVADIALKLEAYYGAPQDIEWALDHNGDLYVLQCRPFQQKAPAGKPGAAPAADDPDVIMRGGVTASPGVAGGPVCVVSKGADVLQFPKGAVLAARQALPSWASLLNRAAAVVTEQGGMAGHLANVAREFGVPALFGLEGFLERVQNGDEVTVHADGLTLYRGRREPAAAAAPAPRNLMAGSPVYTLLERVSRHIIPLTLLDPDAPEFRPENCKTFHDITRFIHEKSVHEMFNFGKSHDFPERSSKQLHYKVPMQWWILNLDDGFRTEARHKYVKLEEIASIPMLAFWAGFAAVPWEGPPLDGKGLVSVMFQSTANPALTPGMRSQYAQRNYFMISKNYCSLTSRLGYHFSTLEALVSERDAENYISFRFKGGAADVARRMKRIHFIGDILENYDFRVEVQEDLLSARIEGYDQDRMVSRLKILGYLSLHTRQLDMIMSNPARVAHYGKKLRNDIDSKVLAAESILH